jgi:hypothetical protein
MTADRDAAAADETGTFHLRVRCLFCGAPHGLAQAPGTHDECGRCRSPLFAANRQRLDYSGQRMLARIPKDLPLEIYTAWPQAAPLAASMRDLSLNGMQLVAAALLQANQIVKIDSAACCALARVAHVRAADGAEERWVVGVEFLTLRFARASGVFVSARA